MPSPFPLVGRTHELAALRTHLRAAAAGQGRLILVGGEAGAGKSFLVQALLAVAPDFAAATGRAPGPGETPPWGPWIEIVRRLHREQGWETADLPAPFGAGPGDWSAYDRAGALGHWLRRQSRPLLAVIEDLQWADGATLELTRHLAGRLAEWPVLVIATYRTDELSRHHPLWSQIPEMQRAGGFHLLLDRFTPADVAQLAAAVLPPDLASPAVAEAIHERTAGLPLFVREMLEAVARTGQLPGPGDPLPQTLRQALDCKLDRLPPAALDALEPAAVIGEHFEYELLARVAGIDEDELTEALQAAVDWHVIGPQDAGGASFAFTHGLLREALLARLVGVRRRRRHARVAGALAAGPEPDPDACAHHLLRAGDPRAAEQLLAAADRARRLGELTRARERLAQALEQMPANHPRRPEVMLKLGQALVWVESERAAACYEEAASGGDPAAALWARFLLLLMAADRHDPRVPEQAAAMMTEQAAFLADPRFRRLEADLFGQVAGYPRAGLLLVRSLVATGQQEEARGQLRQLQVQALPGAMNELQGTSMLLALLGGNLTEAASLCEQAAETALRLRNYRTALILRTNQLHLLLAGAAEPFEAVDALAERIRALEEETWQKTGYALLGREYSLTGVYQYFRGSWRGAVRNVVDAARQNPRAYAGTLGYYAGRILLRSGDTLGARPCIEPLPPRHPGDPVPLSNNFMVLAHALRAELCLALGDPEQARAWLEGAERWPVLADAPFFRGAVQLAWASWHRHADDLKAAWEAARQGLTSARISLSRITEIEAHRLLGELAAARGDEQEAAGQFQAAMELAERCRFPFELALTRLARGRALAHTREGLADLKAVCSYFAAVGCEPALTEARAALARAGADDGAGGGPPPVAPVTLPDGITAREVEVAALVAWGLTDREIAARLFISPKTVDHHLRSIFRKAGVTNRAALAAYAIKRGLVG